MFTDILYAACLHVITGSSEAQGTGI